MKTVFKIIFEKRYYFLLVGASIILQCWCQLELPTYMGNIQRAITEQLGMASIWQSGGIMIGYACAVFVLAVIQNYFGAYLGSYVGQKLREKMFTKVNSLSLTNYDKFGTSTLLTRTTNDVEQIRNFVVMAIRILFMSPTMIIIAVIKTASTQANLTWIIAFCIPILLALMLLLLFYASPLFKRIQKETDDVTVVVRENLTGIRVVRAYCMQDKENEKFDKANDKISKTLLKVNRIMTVANPVVNVVFNIAYIGVYALGFYLLGGTKVTDSSTILILNQITNISIVAQFSMQIMMSFLMFAMVFIMVPQASASISRINEVINTPNAEENPELIKYHEEDLNKSNLKGVIEFKNVTFCYPDSKTPSIENISFKTAPGKTTAIIGSTGSGKSTLINLIPRFYDATSGEILIDGININELPQKTLRDHLGFVPQQALLFKGTIKSNMRFGNENATEEEINEALEVAQAKNFISKLPDGINSYVSQGGKNFSGGQKQRLSIARALVKKPEIYVFDDSFSALDFKTDAHLRQALKPYTKDAGVIIVAQRVSSILDADNIIVLNEGKCVGQGTHTELLSNCSVYQDIVKSQLDPDEVEKTIQMFQNIKLEGGNN